MENFKDITEHQLEVGEIGVYKGLTYIALENPSLVDIKCDECDLCNIGCSNVVCDFDVYFKRHIVAKKEDIDPILESIDDTSDNDSDPIFKPIIIDHPDLFTAKKLLPADKKLINALTEFLIVLRNGEDNNS